MNNKGERNEQTSFTQNPRKLVLYRGHFRNFTLAPQLPGPPGPNQPNQRNL